MIPVVTADGAWTHVTIATHIDATGTPDAFEDVRIKSFGSTVYAATSDFEGGGNDIVLFKSTNNGATWSNVGVVSDAFGTVFDFEVVSATELVACFTNGGDLKFTKSTTSGGLWSTPVDVEATAGIQTACEIIVFGSVYAVVYGDTTDNDVSVKRSTDGGTTWSAAIDIDITANFFPSGVSNPGRTLKFAQRNASAGMLVWERVVAGNPEAPYRSVTSDAGLTWTAVTSIGTTTAIQNVDAVYVTGDRYDVTYTFRVGTDLKYCTSGDNGGSWACSTVLATSTATTQNLQVNPVDTQQIAVLIGLASSTTNPKRASSTDGGANWGAAETIHTFGVGTLMRSIDSIVLPNGNLGVVYNACKQTDETTDVGCNQAGATRIIFTISYATFADLTDFLPVTATVATTNLQGYDVDPLGGTVVIRDDSDIETYTATTLAASGTFASTCNQLDGVMANRDGNLVAFIDCDVGGDPTHLKIRTASLQDPTQSDFSGCAVSGTFICNKDIELDGFSEAGGDGSGKLPRVQDFPINYSSSTPVSGLDRRQIAWGYASISGDAAAVGRVGINAYTNVESGSDIRDFAETQYAPTNVEDFCIGLDGSQYYMTAAGSDTTTKVYPVSFTQTPLNPSLGSPTVYASALSQAKGIACGESRVLIQNAGHVWITSRSGTVQKDITGTSATPSNRGLAVSEIFTIGANATARQFGAYLSDGVISVFDVALCVSLDDCTAVATIEQPTGTWRGMIMDRTAQNLWVFTSTLVSLYTIYTETTIDPVSPQSGSVITPTPTPTTTLLPAQDPANIVGQVITQANAGLGFDVAALFGLVLVLGISVKASRAAPGVPIVVAIAAFIAIIIGVQLGLFDTWVIFATVFLIILAAGGAIFAARSAGKGGDT